MVVTVSHLGYIKRNPLTQYRAQRRGGKGVKGMEAREEDFVERLFVASTHAYILFFTTRGRVHWLKVHELPQLGRAARGQALINVLQLAEGERVQATLPVRSFEEARERLRHARAPARASSRRRARRLLEPAPRRDHRHQPRPEDELIAALPHQRQPGGADREQERQVDPLPRERRCAPMGRTAAGVRGMIARAGRRGGRHGDPLARRHDPHRHRARLRQAHAARATTGCRSAAARA